MSLPEVDPAALAKVQAIVSSLNSDHWHDVDPPEAATEPDERMVDRLRMALLSIDELNALPAPEPLIDGLLVKNSLAVMWGLWATGKSFLALDFALCVASGKAWQARAVAQGPVLYVAAEGTGGLRKRVAAWQYAWKVPGRIPITFLPKAVNLRDVEQVAALCAIAHDMHPSLIVVDTLSRSIPGGDENSPKDMTAAVASLDRLRRAAGACVLVVHHSDKTGSTSRGHGSMEGAADTSLKVSKPEDVITMELVKQKDGTPIPALTLRLRMVNDTCVVEAENARATFHFAQGLMFQALGLLDETFGVEALTTRDLMDALGKSRPTVCRMLADLQRHGYVVNISTPKRPRWEITTTGRDARMSHVAQALPEVLPRT